MENECPYKQMGLIKKPGGFNLLIERDAGNEVLILMSKGEVDWENLRDKCDLALDRIAQMRKTGEDGMP